MIVIALNTQFQSDLYMHDNYLLITGTFNGEGTTYPTIHYKFKIPQQMPLITFKVNTFHHHSVVVCS